MLKTKEEITAWLNRNEIVRYKINDDLTVDVLANVDLKDRGLVEIPVFFNFVEADFNCSENELTSLLGAPKQVGGSFNCSKNKLESLDFSPEYVGSMFICKNNKIKSLKGITKKINGSIYCSHNKIESFEGLPKHIIGNLNLNNNKLINLNNCPEKISGHFDCSNNQINDISCSIKGEIKKLNLDNNNIKNINNLDVNLTHLMLRNNPIDLAVPIIVKSIGKIEDGIIFNLSGSLSNMNLDKYKIHENDYLLKIEDVIKISAAFLLDDLLKPSINIKNSIKKI